MARGRRSCSIGRPPCKGRAWRRQGTAWRGIRRRTASANARCSRRGVAPFSAVPVALRPMCASHRTLPKSSPASVPRLRRAIAAVRGKAVLPSRAVARPCVRSAVSTEIDRGTAFILIPVFLALGAIVYFSLGHRTGFLAARRRSSLPAAIVAATRSRPAVNLALAAVLLCILGATVAKVETWRAGTKMLGGEIIDAAHRTRRGDRASRHRPRAADHRRHRHGKAGAALCARPRAGFGAQDSGRHRGRVGCHRPRPADAAVRAGQAGQLRFFLRKLFRRHRRERLLPART